MERKAVKLKPSFRSQPKALDGSKFVSTFHYYGVIGHIRPQCHKFKMHVKCLIAETTIKKDEKICCNHVVVPDFVSIVCSTSKDISMDIPPHKRNQNVDSKEIGRRRVGKEC